MCSSGASATTVAPPDARSPVQNEIHSPRGSGTERERARSSSQLLARGGRRALHRRRRRYNPLTGRGLGARHFAMSALVVDLLVNPT